MHSLPKPEQSNPTLTRHEQEQDMILQAYSVRFQTVITGQDYRGGDQDQKKQLLGTFIYDHVKQFLERMLLQRGISQ